MNIWVDFLIVWGVLSGAALWFLAGRYMLVVEELQSIKSAVGSQDLQSIKELDAVLVRLENEKMLMNDQNGELWKENVRLRKMQDVIADKGKMARLEEWIEETDERNRQMLAALGYQSMTVNKLESQLGIVTPDYIPPGEKAIVEFPVLIDEPTEAEVLDMERRQM